jgi:hypothetical protein
MNERGLGGDIEGRENLKEEVSGVLRHLTPVISEGFCQLVAECYQQLLPGT